MPPAPNCLTLVPRKKARRIHHHIPFKHGNFIWKPARQLGSWNCSPISWQLFEQTMSTLKGHFLWKMRHIMLRIIGNIFKKPSVNPFRGIRGQDHTDTLAKGLSIIIRNYRWFPRNIFANSKVCDISNGVFFFRGIWSGIFYQNKNHPNVYQTLMLQKFTSMSIATHLLSLASHHLR